MGRAPADLVIVGGRLLNSATGEVESADIAIADRWIAVVGDIEHTVGPRTIRIDAEDRLVVPGLIDAHFHIEGSLVTVHELARALLPRGVTTLLCDPHEIGNVLGPAGMAALIDEAAGLPLKVFLRVPLQIPGTPGLETTGGVLDDRALGELLAHPSAVSVAGDCSPTWLLDPDLSHLARLNTALAARFTANGQEPGLDPPSLNAFAAAGPQDTHIATSCDMLLRELRLGLRAVINDMPGQFPDEELAQLAAVLATGAVDSRHLLLCADDVHPNRLLRVGGVDAAVRRAIRCGIPPATAVRMATINVATHYRIDNVFGSLAPGRVADVVVIDDVQEFTAAIVIADGLRIDELSVPTTPVAYPAWAYNTVHLARPLTAEDFRLAPPIGAGDGDTVELVAIYPGRSHDSRLLPGTEKEERRLTGRVYNGAIELIDAGDSALAAIVDRHHASGRIGQGVVQGFGLRAGAVASTVNHDNHNLLVVGVNVEDMALAANAVADAGGGIALAKGGQVLELLPLPIAGLLSDQPIETVAADMDRLESCLAADLGVNSDIVQPLMLVQMFALANIPTLGLTDLGVVDVLARSIKPLAVRAD
jgi:adenine deaminase